MIMEDMTNEKVVFQINSAAHFTNTGNIAESHRPKRRKTIKTGWIIFIRGNERNTLHIYNENFVYRCDA